MKVSSSRGRSPSVSTAKGEARRSVEVRQGAFLRALEAAETAAMHRDFEEGFQSVEEAARALKQSPTLENLHAYKRAIHDFLTKVVSGAYTVEHMRTFTRKGRPAISVLVRTVDERLEQLAREVMSASKDATAIAAMIDDIRGIILDYFR